MKHGREEVRVLSFTEHAPLQDVLAGATIIDDDVTLPAETATATQQVSTSVAELMAPLRPFLDDARVLELAINQPGELFLETTQHWMRVPCQEMDFRHCLSLANAIATATNQTINETTPILSATLATQERVQIVIPPTVEDGLVSFTFRKPSKTIWTLDDFTRQGVFNRSNAVQTADEATDWDNHSQIKPCGVHLNVDSPDEVRDKRHLLEPFEIELLQLLWSGQIAQFMKQAVKTRRNLAVSGATGSGKTTFMKGIMQECSRAERLITIEDAREIFLPNHPNKVHLLYSKGGQGVATVTASKLLVSCLRMKPDRILLAEIREAECYDFLRVAASGHPGSITSLHAGSCMEAFEQMGLMIRQSEAGAGLAHAETQRLLRLLLDVIVQYSKQGGRRCVTEIYYRPLRKKELAV